MATTSESKGGFGETPLSWAAKSGHQTVVKLLLEKGADVKSRDGGGQTPLSRAARP
jgi:ankyrin repeat protein